MEKIINKYTNLTLTKKLIYSYIIIVAIPVIILSIGIFKNIETTNIEDIEVKSNFDLEQEYDAVAKNMEILGSIAQSTISNKPFMEFIDNDKQCSIDEIIDFKQTTYKDVINFQNNNPAISQINIFTNNPNINEIWPLIYKEERIKQNEWVQKTLQSKGRVYWNINHYDNDVNIEKNRESKEMIVSLNRELKYTSEKHTGIIRVQMISKRFFPKMFENRKNSYNQIFLINDEGIFTNDKSYFNIDYNIDQNEILKKFKERIDSGKKIKNNKFDIKIGEEKFTCVFKEAPFDSGYLLSLISIEAAQGNIKKSTTIVILVASVLLLALSLIIRQVTSLILKRLYIIIEYIQKVEKGNLNVDIPVYGNDEIGILASSFRSMLNSINALIQESISKQITTEQAELKALKNQIDAHFLYNTLENIRMMAEIKENYEVSDSLVSLGDMMRYNMKWDNEYVQIRDEINHIKNYIALIEIRYDHNINLNINIDEELKNKEILKMTLQPIVENAVKHGLAKKLKKSDGNINISCFRKDKVIYIQILDNGIGVSEEIITDLNNKFQKNISGNKGLGLSNVNQRIKLYWGPKYGLNIDSRVGYYTKITVSLPEWGRDFFE